MIALIALWNEVVRAISLALCRIVPVSLAWCIVRLIQVTSAVIQIHQVVSVPIPEEEVETVKGEVAASSVGIRHAPSWR